MALIKNNSHCGVKYLDRFAELVCHVADDPEDDEAGEHAGDAVADGDDDGVPEHVVMEVVVACQGDHHAPRHAWYYQPIREQSDVQSTNELRDEDRRSDKVFCLVTYRWRRRFVYTPLPRSVKNVKNVIIIKFKEPEATFSQ